MANHIPKLPKNSPLSLLPLEQLVYLYLISDATESSNKITSFATVTRVIDRFYNYEVKELNKALDDLEESGLVRIENDYIIVGENEKLFVGSKTDVGIDYKQLLELADAFIETARGASKRMAKRVKEDIDKLSAVPLDQWRISEFVDLFRYSYEVTYQEIHREFQSKEFGQMKNFVKLYSYDVVAKMIVHYVMKADNYGKSEPTIASMCFHKDAIFADMKGTKVSRDNVVRTKTVKSRF